MNQAAYFVHQLVKAFAKIRVYEPGNEFQVFLGNSKGKILFKVVHKD